MNLAMTGSNRLRGIRQGAAAALLALTLSGCISLGGKAPKMLIGLTADQSPAAGALPSGPQADALVVLDPEAGRKLDVLRIPVQVDDARIAYLTDVTWVERPARLFRQLIAETIRSHYDRLERIAVDVKRLGFEVASEILSTAMPQTPNCLAANSFMISSAPPPIIMTLTSR